MDSVPASLVSTGVYARTRNPMYLGHLLVLGGLALWARSPALGAVLGWHIAWFDRRVRLDEARLESLWGEPYRAYLRRVPRWLCVDRLPAASCPRKTIAAS
jgi:protein-S-isoprenylcysteine O-methyltransferase Ste14